MSDENNILPKEIEVKLGASSYERRKAAASEVENLIKAHNEQGDGAKIKKLIGLKLCLMNPIRRISKKYSFIFLKIN